MNGNNRTLYKVLNWMVFMTFILVVVFMAVIGYMAFWPIKVYEVSNTAQVLTPRVRAGEFMTYRVIYSKYKDLSATVTKQIYYLDSNLVINLPNTNSTLPIARNKEMIAKTTLIPIHAPPGKVKVVITPIYEVNMFQTYRFKHETEPFEIVK